MKKLNFLTGLLTKLAGILVAVVGLIFISIVAEASVFSLSASQLYAAAGWKYLAIFAAIELVAIYLFITGTKYLVDSARYIDFEKGQRARIWEVFINFIVISALLGGEIYGIVKLVLGKTDFLALPLKHLVTVGALTLVTVLLFVLLIAKLTKTVKYQGQYRPARRVKVKKQRSKPVVESKVESKQQDNRNKDFVEPRFNIGKK